MVSINFQTQQEVDEELPVDKQLNILVVDDHPLMLTGTFDVLNRDYSHASILKAQTAQETLSLIESHHFDLIVMDLSIPDKKGQRAEVDLGIQLLQNLLKEYPHQNFIVQSSYVKALIRIKHDIDNHQGGFAIADKGLPEDEMLTRVQLAIIGATHTQDIKAGIELKPEWMEVLRMAFEDGLTDKEISNRMYKSERAIRTYWTKIQDVLGVYPEDCKQTGKNLRIQTEICAREEGLID